MNDTELSPAATAADVLGALIDQIAATDRILASVSAVRAELVDRARQVSEAAVSLVPSDGSSLHGWDARVVARREFVSDLACSLRLPERTTETLIETSRSLVHDLPETMAALSGGSISYRHAQKIVDHADSLPAEARVSFDRAVRPAAETLTVAKLDRRARIEREHRHPETIATRCAASARDRHVEFIPARDGMAWLNAYLPAVPASAVFNRLTDIALDLQGVGESRALAQLRADVFSYLLLDGVVTDGVGTDGVGTSGGDSTAGDGATTDSIAATVSPTESIDDAARPGDVLAHGVVGSDTRSGNSPLAHAPLGQGIRATVLVTVPVMTLLGSAEEPGVLEGYGPIDPDTARELAAGAPSFIRLLTHPETGAVLSVGRDRYVVPQDLRRWLRVRDGTCRFPGCGRGARRSDVDHTVDWQHGSSTDHDNLAHLCGVHHRFKHRTRWSVTQREGGVLDWTSATGHRYSTEPAVRLPTPTVR